MKYIGDLTAVGKFFFFWKEWHVFAWVSAIYCLLFHSFGVFASSWLIYASLLPVAPEWTNESQHGQAGNTAGRWLKGMSHHCQVNMDTFHDSYYGLLKSKIAPRAQKFTSWKDRIPYFFATCATQTVSELITTELQRFTRPKENIIMAKQEGILNSNNVEMPNSKSCITQLWERLELYLNKPFAWRRNDWLSVNEDQLTIYSRPCDAFWQKHFEDIEVMRTQNYLKLDQKDLFMREKQGKAMKGKARKNLK